MAILQAILAVLLRQSGRLLNTAFGWATMLLFGKVPEKRQLYLSVITFGSVLWIVVVLGIIFPQVGTFLLAFIPLPHWVDRNWVRLAMLIAAVIVPPLVGLISQFLVEPERRPREITSKLREMLKGYPYTLGLALTLLWMIVFAPVMKLRTIIKRWTSTHVPVVVEPQDYLNVVGDIQRILRARGIPTGRTKASWMVRWPTRMLTFFAGGGIKDITAEHLTLLQSSQVEVLLHPSDLVIQGKEKEVTRAHAFITEHLTFTKAYLTWSREANQMEDRLGEVWQAVQGRGQFSQQDALARLGEIRRQLQTLQVSYEEWEILFREVLVVESALLKRLTGAAGQTEEPGGSPEEEIPLQGAETSTPIEHAKHPLPALDPLR